MNISLAFLLTAWTGLIAVVYAATRHPDALLEGGPLTWLVSVSFLLIGLAGIALDKRFRSE